MTDLERANYNTLPYKTELIQAYDAYFEAVETLLDSINNYDEAFMDIIMEIDTYFYYEIARQRVEFLNSMEDNAETGWSDYNNFLKEHQLKPFNTIEE